ncbi:MULTISPECIES: VOC family protein [Streptomyces]|uniref:VOC family protein n=3 Tax=Streptomyces rochei group TaxID=2867164 RepID=A0AAX3ZIV5_STRRO|nr:MULTISPECIES: VOC family protein [Streptomyces]MBD2817891.1 VOC family protein [Streptomyces parvulus]MDV6289526.1 VOC family protein [Streptomyces sp. UP1A-1]RIH61379.1 VOC family protein [Streptomyces sp. SHP22-7]MBJ6619902.1 VOC family protein [Streptomyces sp. DHE17-7]MBQ0882543.1 VOC family protein [Streptomyces sp. RT42]
MAIAELGVVVLDCPDPHALARFYADVLGGTVEDKSDGQDEWVDLNLPGGQTLAFQGAPEYVPPKWPGPDGAQQFHLDLDVKDLDAAEKAVLELGAKPLDAEDRSRTFRVYADPAGHPFCLCAC